ncbi:MAG: DUF134 domain-containing protein [Candidatus Margulisbacteria bacterium]|nr:DUF134 domain-containing protein [Candidatus Margulisiibacteriota bacterium]
MSPFTRKPRYCRPFFGSEFFKPRGIPLSELEIISLELDELEAFHLCDYEELSQMEAAERMNISASTLQRLLYSGRKKIAEALYSSKALEIKTSDNITMKTEKKEMPIVANRKRKGQCWKNI